MCRKPRRVRRRLGALLSGRPSGQAGPRHARAGVTGGRRSEGFIFTSFHSRLDRGNQDGLRLGRWRSRSGSTKGIDSKVTVHTMFLLRDCVCLIRPLFVARRSAPHSSLPAAMEWQRFTNSSFKSHFLFTMFNRDEDGWSSRVAPDAPNERLRVDQEESRPPSMKEGCGPTLPRLVQLCPWRG